MIYLVILEDGLTVSVLCDSGYLDLTVEFPCVTTHWP